MRIRKWIAALALTAALGLQLANPSAGAQAAGQISIELDGQAVPSDVSPYIVPKANLTVVPLRVIGEGLGAGVDWSSAEKTVTIGWPEKTIVMTLGKSYATVNGGSVSLGTPVAMIKNRVMVPLRFVGEQLGLRVDWNPASRKITLLTGGFDPSLAGGAASDEGSGPSSGIGGGGEPDMGTGPGTGNNSGTGANAGGGETGSADGNISAKDGMKAAWISSVANIDWPSPAAVGNSARQQTEYTQMLDKLQEMGINTVFVQVRPSADALYPSSLVPWSKYLTGTSGKAPDYDPLAFMVEETHKRGMQFQAWFNPFRANSGTSISGLDETHVIKQHPEWIVQSGGSYYINPGVPAARQHIIDAIMEVVNGYDIDGVHLDDYFYPTDGPFGDDVTFRTYNDKHIAKLEDWRRDNINAFIRHLGQSIHQAKPQVQFGVSPFGVWRNKAADPTGSDTKAGLTSYDSMYADVRTWIRQDWIDYVVPQVYWSFDFSPVHYDKLVDWWANEVRGTGVKLYIGHSPYKIGTSEAGWQSAQEIIDQLSYDAALPEVSGDAFFSAKDLIRNPLGLVPLLSSYYGAGQ